MEENHIQTESDNRKELIMESEDTQTMEGEALVADCEIMKENLTEFTGTEKQLDDS